MRSPSSGLLTLTCRRNHWRTGELVGIALGWELWQKNENRYIHFSHLTDISVDIESSWCRHSISKAHALMEEATTTTVSLRFRRFRQGRSLIIRFWAAQRKPNFRTNHVISPPSPRCFESLWSLFGSQSPVFFLSPDNIYRPWGPKSTLLGCKLSCIDQAHLFSHSII